ncbi:MAG: hypothetical protein AAF799_07345 [Myxococcota bacterium]
MTPHDDFDPQTDRAIDDLLDAASEEAESDEIVVPPFAAVLNRARRLDPGLQTNQPVRPAPPSSPDEAALVAAIAPFVEAARAEAEVDVYAQTQQPPPGLPRPGSRIARWAVVGGALAAAAAILLLVGLIDVRNALRSEAQRDDNQAIDQANSDRRVLEADTEGTPDKPQLVRAPRARRAPVTPAPLPPEEAIVPEEPVPLEEVAPPEPEPTPEPTKTRRKRATERKDRRVEALQRMDAEAQDRLHAGDIAGAEKAFRAIVRKGGRSSLAQLAYGDLFTLAHRRGDTAGQGTLWREYLRKFPRGRFADDARAGLCRQSTKSKRSGCWERYLDDFPTGAYHRQAERALSRGPGAASGEPRE